MTDRMTVARAIATALHGTDTYAANFLVAADAAIEAHRNHDAMVSVPKEFVDSVRYVYDHFVEDEKQGYRSKDRQFAIDILGKAGLDLLK
ncbi:MAG: hypothetical protein EOS12_28625 [Mesorhizobium sp.]|nr:MAG: hypothetical protein EOS12_28625 [Mesorhizobium sp.]